jgi:glycosyltransferase involved in cell wall biosynthesis
MEKISLIVIARNEEANIGRCLASAAPVVSRMIVVDAHSDDRTVEVARTYTPDVFVRDWAGYAAQKQWALEQCDTEWVLWMDADEEMSSALRDEIRALDFAADGYAVPRRVYYLGQWIRHCGWYPDHVTRLFRRERGRFADMLVHEHVELEGRVERLRGDLYHYTYRDIAHHLAKMNEFTTLAAQQMHRQGRRVSAAGMLAHTIGAFVSMYLVKSGYRDRAAGLVVSVLGSYYVFLKYAKLLEMQRAESQVS